MPPPDDSFYNMKKLHVVFALSAAALLGVTVWMVAADHWRPWKVYQRTFQDQIEPWLTEARLRQEQTRPSADGDPAKHQATVDRLEHTLHQQNTTWGRTVLGLPLIDALGRPSSIHQIWLPDLTIDNRFGNIARFDRCTTCHMAIDRTQPGSTSQSACPVQHTLTIALPQPSDAAKTPTPTLEDFYGFLLAPRGMLDPNAPTVGLVRPRTSAARAGLLAGDILLAIDGQPVADPTAAEATLLRREHSGDAPLKLQIRRGLPQPYASHPRLDLFLGSNSPHPIAQFGCTICHDGQGSATEFKFASHTPADPAQRRRWQQQYGWFWNECWDLPMRLGRFTQSSCLQCHHDVVDLEPTDRFPDPPAPKLLEGYHLVRRYGCFGCHEIKGVGPSGERIGPDMRLPKVGPSLRNVRGKLNSQFIEGWIAEPSRFRPQTPMPQLFGLNGHLDAEGRSHTQRLESVEVRAAAEYLLHASQPISPLDPPSQVTEPPSAQRGKRLFLIKGCAACHKHADVPQATSVQGPDLTNLGSKITTNAGRTWLVSWIRDPAHHSPQSLMPNALLEPVQLSPANDPPAKPRWTDPAADIAAYLLTSTGGTIAPPPTLVDKDLDELTLLYLTKSYPPEMAQKYLAQGIPPATADDLPADVQELSAPIDSTKKLRYVGRHTIAKRGCFGCHDTPGFEHAQPIGPALSDWGRKQTSLLAFGHVDAYATHQGRAGQGTAPQESPPASKSSAPSSSPEHDSTDELLDALRNHRREGFLWQKLRDPRSFDYQTAAAKTFNDQLRMGRFSLTDRQREAIATFVLGLVAQPPNARYLPQPAPQRQAIIDGKKVLDRYGCAECHTLGLPHWTFAYDPQQFPDPVPTPDFARARPHIPAEVLAASRRLDDRGLAQAQVVGMPRVDAQGNLVAEEDDDGNPLYFFTLWEPAAVNGKLWSVGGAEVPIAASQIVSQRDPWGGAFARLLYPIAIREARAAGSSVLESEGWSWVPPTLVHEGAAVQPAWLYDFLRDPATIRPAAVLRMPKFAISPGEVAKLVDYFAAASGVPFPYESSTTDRKLASSKRMKQAMRLLTDRTTYCAKCHSIGDFHPGTDAQTILAPNLDQICHRIRPEHLRRWLANPKSVLPYTGMPVNFPPEGPPMGQDLLQGTSVQQLDAVQSLLLNYDAYVKSQFSIRQMIQRASDDKAGQGGGAPDKGS